MDRVYESASGGGGAVPFLVVLLLASVMAGSEAAADPIGVRWPQQPSRGAPLTVTYSYSNLLDGTFLLVTPGQIRTATEEALGLWARYAPVHFVEQPDSGPAPSEASYPAAGHPQIRFGHHRTPDWAHAFHPDLSDGLGGDVHLGTGAPWSVNNSSPWNLLEVLVHEIGHSLGLHHELRFVAMMNATFGGRYHGLGTAHLFAADINAIRGLYGAGVGSVSPLEAAVPEPSTIVLVVSGAVAAIARRRRRRERGQPHSRKGDSHTFPACVMGKV